MKALQFHASVPRYALARLLGKRYSISALPLTLKELPAPVPPPGWTRVDVRLSGICGSDLANLYGKQSPRLTAFFSLPAVFGHEIVGECEGARVVVNPLLGCHEKGREPCPACARGEEQRCLEVGEGPQVGSMIGFDRTFPGGWSEQVVCRPEKLCPVPDSVPDTRAVLTEPYAVALRGIKLAFEASWPAEILVIGSGTIGLLSISVLRQLGYTGQLHVVARHAHQAELAKRLGADRLHGSVPEASQAVGARSYPAVIGPPAWRGGFSAVINAAGSSSSLAAASWAVVEGGTLLLLGAPGVIVGHDFSAYWFRELTLLGSYTYTHQQFKEALTLLAAAAELDTLVGQPFALGDWPAAIRAVVGRHVHKGVFAPNRSS